MVYSGLVLTTSFEVSTMISQLSYSVFNKADVIKKIRDINGSIWRSLTIISVSIILGACSTSKLAPVTDLTADLNKNYFHKRSKSVTKSTPAKRQNKVSNGYHRVADGETLFAIAWQYGHDFRSLARANNIVAPYTIFPGQLIRLKSAKPTSSKKTSSEKVAKTASSSNKMTSRYKNNKSNEKVIHKNNSFGGTKGVHIIWRWPANGRVINKFSKTGIGKKGLDISGVRGDPVRAAADGKVVYSGSLIGYGNLVIIKHDDLYLSAYAHNSQLHVNEGMAVKAGQKIAEIGSSGSDRVKLHFEIRKEGKPVDPIQLLPKKS